MSRQKDFTPQRQSAPRQPEQHAGRLRLQQPVAVPPQPGAAQPRPLRPVSPHAYRPQSLPRVLQLKTGANLSATKAAAGTRQQPVSPPAYRPQPLPRVLQRKVSGQSHGRAQVAPSASTPARLAGQVSQSIQPKTTAHKIKSGPSPVKAAGPVAPPVYRPQPTPKVLQRATANPKSAALQRKVSGGVGNGQRPSAPPVYRPQATPKVLQKKMIQPAGVAQAKLLSPNASAHNRRSGQRSPLNPRAGVIQPMIGVLNDNLADIHIWHQVYNMLKKEGHGAEDVEVFEHIKEVKSGDRLALVGHGNEKGIGRWYNPNILANSLNKIKLPGDLKRIEILTCRSGVGDEKSFAAELSKQIMRKHPVVGYRGDNFTTGEGKNRAEPLGSTVADYYRNLLKELAKTGQLPSEVATKITHAQDPLAVIGLSNKTFEGMDDIEVAMPIVMEAFKSIMPEEDKQQAIEEENKTDQKLIVFMEKFNQTVELIRGNKEQSLKPVLIETVEEYLSILGNSPTIGNIKEIVPQGRVIFQRESGEMVIKTHKEYL
ncbi:MAG: hypothetical protein QOH25_1956 [Acidobacteriota bacterium]|nr:hypothetical protein [Acidobacteriota bacterium]